MADFEERRAAFEKAGATIIAGSVDNEEDTRKLVQKHGLGFPVAIDMSREDAEALGAWWQDKKGHMQPSEFIVRSDGEVVFSSYSDGPIGRMDPDHALKLIGLLEGDD